MDKKTVYNAICKIDEAQLNEYDYNCKAIKKRKKKRQAVAITACLVTTVIAGLYLNSTGVLPVKNNNTDAPLTAVSETTAAKEEASYSSALSQTETTDGKNNSVPSQAEGNQTEASYSSASSGTEATGEKSDPAPSQTESETSDSTENDDAQKGDYVNESGGFCAFWWKKKLNMRGPLYFAIDNSPNIEFKIIALYSPATANITDFVYEGKSLSEWAISAYGKEDASQEARDGYKRAYNAYLEEAIPRAVSLMNESGIECKRADYTTNGIAFTATADQLDSLHSADWKDWCFDLYSGNLKGETEYDKVGADDLAVIN